MVTHLPGTESPAAWQCCATCDYTRNNETILSVSASDYLYFFLTHNHTCSCYILSLSAGQCVSSSKAAFAFPQSEVVYKYGLHLYRSESPALEYL